MIARRFFAVAHIAIGVLLMPLIVATLLVAAPVLLIGPIWGVMLGLRLWQPEVAVTSAVRWTHSVYLVIDMLLVVYGVSMLRAAAASAGGGGGLLGGVGLFPIGLAIVLAMFSLVTLLWSFISAPTPPRP